MSYHYGTPNTLDLESIAQKASWAAERQLGGTKTQSHTACIGTFSICALHKSFQLLSAFIGRLPKPWTLVFKAVENLGLKETLWFSPCLCKTVFSHKFTCLSGPFCSQILGKHFSADLFYLIVRYWYYFLFSPITNRFDICVCSHCFWIQDVALILKKISSLFPF